MTELSEVQIRSIDTLDITSPEQVRDWVNHNANYPTRGLGDQRNPDGTRFSFDQRVEASRDYLTGLVPAMLHRNKPPDQIKSKLVDFVNRLERSYFSEVPPVNNPEALEDWIECHVRTVDVSFDHLPSEDGLRATQEQVRLQVKNSLGDNRPIEDIQNELMTDAHGSQAILESTLVHK